MFSLSNNQSHQKVNLMWSRSAAVVGTLALAACLAACGDAGAPGPDSATIAPQVLVPSIAPAAGSGPVSTNTVAPQILAPVLHRHQARDRLSPSP